MYHTNIDMYIYIYVCMYEYVCVYLSVCMYGNRSNGGTAGSAFVHPTMNHYYEIRAAYANMPPISNDYCEVFYYMISFDFRNLGLTKTYHTASD